MGRTMKQTFLAMTIVVVCGSLAFAGGEEDTVAGPLSINCAAAIHVSMTELTARYETNTAEFISSSGEEWEVFCDEEDSFIRIVFGPRNHHQRGGSMTYILDPDSLEIEEIIPGR